VKPRKIVLTDAAVNDILEQANWYHDQSGTQTGEQMGTECKFNTSAPDGKSFCRCTLLFQNH
jgi:hypothetical protein